MHSKKELLYWTFTTNIVSNNVNLDKILKSNLGYKELGNTWISLDYLYRVQKNPFAMIWQLGPPNFFVTFTTCMKNWPIFVETLIYLYINILVKI